MCVCVYALLLNTIYVLSHLCQNLWSAHRKKKFIHFLRGGSWDHATPLSLNAQCIPDDISCRFVIEWCSVCADDTWQCRRPVSHATTPGRRYLFNLRVLLHAVFSLVDARFISATVISRIFNVGDTAGSNRVSLDLDHPQSDSVNLCDSTTLCLSRSIILHSELLPVSLMKLFTWPFISVPSQR